MEFRDVITSARQGSGDYSNHVRMVPDLHGVKLFLEPGATTTSATDSAMHRPGSRTGHAPGHHYDAVAEAGRATSRQLYIERLNNAHKQEA